MCPLWPAHYILLYILIICPLWLLSFQLIGAAAKAASQFDVSFNPTNVSHLKVGEVQLVEVYFNKSDLLGNETDGTDGRASDLVVEYIIADPSLAQISPSHVDLVDSSNPSEKGPLQFNLTGNFLGYTNVVVRVKKENETFVSSPLPVTVLRVTRAIDRAFLYSVASLVAIIYVNMGAALDTRIVTETMKRPIGPGIGFFSQFVIMPVLSYFIAKWLLPYPYLQLGLFITGCSPGGGASNIWTLALGGNLDLSITMTTISTFSAFIMMPVWILTVGATIMAEAKLGIPYRNIGTFALALIVPLTIGIVIQRTLPKVAKVLVRALKPFAICLIIFIVAFAIYTNLFLFKLFSLEILLSGLLLPWLGYLLGGGIAKLLQQDWKDVIAIGIETGVQNTGLAILALKFSLPAPESDLATVLPVAVAIMTPVVPAAVMLIQKLTGCNKSKRQTKDLLFGTPSASGSDEISQQSDKFLPKC